MNDSLSARQTQNLQRSVLNGLWNDKPKVVDFKTSYVTTHVGVVLDKHADVTDGSVVKGLSCYPGLRAIESAPLPSLYPSI